ncbi:hypothetical protein NEOLEDRAFT_1180898 [Neolentinus lepideus HHB14362 ss-1]|uniref:Uncharacterized protein n=1 Tax=Neolentinus lepideus HHB14362 ss-1 TaxID=1314782 RepID=A0A165QJ49_9AGAM|nr:hypothetical protein NEOLEDRAFT_1180898 [Neolentinus lepideus HHB14362 ss-1]
MTFRRINRARAANLHIDIALAGFGAEGYAHHYLRWHVKSEEEEIKPFSSRALELLSQPQDHRGEGVPFVCLQALVPGLYVAFHDASRHQPHASPRGRSFTHAITITIDSPQAPYTTYLSPYGTHHLVLHLEPPRADSSVVNSNALCKKKRICGLTEAQLMASLDFLSLALLYLPKHLHLLQPGSPHVKTNAVILAPRGMPELAMDVAANYLAWASEKGENFVRNCISEEKEGVVEPWRQAL